MTLTGSIEGWIPKLFRKRRTYRRKNVRKERWNFSPPAAKAV